MAAQKTIGTTLTKTTGTPATIADLTSIGEIGVESDEIDVTTLDSEDDYREFIAGLKDAGEVSLEGIVKSEDNMEDMLTLVEAQSVESWEVEFPDGQKWWFRGFLKTWKEADIETEGKRGFTGTIRISGKPTYSSTGVSA